MPVEGAAWAAGELGQLLGSQRRRALIVVAPAQAQETGHGDDQGVVDAGARRRLLEEIKAKLEALVDPANGEKVVSCAYISEDSFSKNFIERAPDIILGFHRGYRISDNSALGTLNSDIVIDNMGWWSGDHCVDPKRVPASFVSSFKIQSPLPDMRDVAPTILKYFGIATPAPMTGKALI